MKNSIYNTLISITKNSDILYNSYSNTFLVIASEVSKHLGEPVFIKSQWKNLYKELIKNEFYVSDRVDEFERLKQKAYQIATFDKSFFLIINPTLDCNLRCWYCYENHVQGSVMEESMQQRVKLLIEQICKSSIESFTLGFFGGEPLMKYNSIVRPLIEFTQKICEEHHIHFNTTFTSNGTLLNANIIQQLTSFSPVSFQITLDGDEECHNKVRFFHNKKGTYRLIMENIRILLANKCRVTLRINHTSESVSSISSVIDELKEMEAEYKAYLFVDFHRVWQDKKGMGILPEIKEYTDKLEKTKVHAKYNSLNEINTPCYGDRKNTAVVNYNGDVFKCTAKDFTKENREGYLDEQGNIVWEKSQEHRLNSKLANKPCHTCSIAPLCGSGCTRYILEQETKKEYCLLDYSDEKKQKIVIEQIETIIRKNEIPSLSAI